MQQVHHIQAPVVRAPSCTRHAQHRARRHHHKVEARRALWTGCAEHAVANALPAAERVGAVGLHEHERHGVPCQPAVRVRGHRMPRLVEPHVAIPRPLAHKPLPQLVAPHAPQPNQRAAHPLPELVVAVGGADAAPDISGMGVQRPVRRGGDRQGVHVQLDAWRLRPSPCPCACAYDPPSRAVVGRQAGNVRVGHHPEPMDVRAAKQPRSRLHPWQREAAARGVRHGLCIHTHHQPREHQVPVDGNPAYRHVSRPAKPHRRGRVACWQLPCVQQHLQGIVVVEPVCQPRRIRHQRPWSRSGGTDDASSRERALGWAGQLFEVACHVHAVHGQPHGAVGNRRPHMPEHGVQAIDHGRQQLFEGSEHRHTNCPGGGKDRVIEYPESHPSAAMHTLVQPRQQRRGNGVHQRHAAGHLRLLPRHVVRSVCAGRRRRWFLVMYALRTPGITLEVMVWLVDVLVHPGGGHISLRRRCYR